MKLKRKLKKAFTLVELVVVIAVIAILGAVSVAAYFGVTNAAKTSADEQAVYQMNTLLAVLEADEKPKYLTDIHSYFSENGLDTEDYTPLSNGYNFYWDSSENLVLYVNEDSMEVVYPEDQKNNTDSSDWLVLTGTIKETTYTASDITNDTVTVDSASELAGIISYYNDSKPENLTVNIDSDINMMGSSSKFIVPEDGTLTFNGNNHTISNSVSNKVTTTSNDNFDIIQAGYSYALIVGSGKKGEIYNSNITVKDLTIENSDVYASGNFASFLVSAIYKTNLTIENVNISNGNLYGSGKTGGFVGIVQGSSKVTLKNSYIKDSTITTKLFQSGGVAGWVDSSSYVVFDGDNYDPISNVTFNYEESSRCYYAETTLNALNSKFSTSIDNSASNGVYAFWKTTGEIYSPIAKYYTTNFGFTYTDSDSTRGSYDVIGTKTLDGYELTIYLSSDGGLPVGTLDQVAQLETSSRTSFWYN